MMGWGERFRARDPWEAIQKPIIVAPADSPIEPSRAQIAAAAPPVVRIIREGVTITDVEALTDALWAKVQLGQLEGRDLVAQVVVDTLLVADGTLPVEAFT